MFSSVVERDDLTIAACGYSIAGMNPGSHDVVVVECTNCHALLRRERRGMERKHQCPVVIGNKKRCHRCNQLKDLSLFNRNGKLSGGVAKLCRECYNGHPAVKKLESQRCARLRMAAKDGDYKFYINRRIARLIARARCNKIECNITTAIMIDLWEKQAGLCHYSGLPMIGTGSDNGGMPTWNSPSVDRLRPHEGYVVGNVAWCLYGVNAFKHTLSEDEFVAVLASIKWPCLTKHKRRKSAVA